MADQTPTLGRIVHYRLSAADVGLIQHRRDADDIACNAVREGDVYAAVIVRVFGPVTAVNLRVLLDGDDTYWATSRLPGDQPGRWDWPPRV